MTEDRFCLSVVLSRGSQTRFQPFLRLITLFNCRRQMSGSTIAGSRTASRTFTQQRVFFNRMVKNTKITLTSQHVLFSGAAVQHGGGSWYSQPGQLCVSGCRKDGAGSFHRSVFHKVSSHDWTAGTRWGFCYLRVVEIKKGRPSRLIPGQRYFSMKFMGSEEK